MLRIITLNLNGIRSASNKGFYEWLSGQRADVICLQEVRAHLPDMAEEMRNPRGYKGYFHLAEKKGYSGVGIYTKAEPDQIVEGLGIKEIDEEGRYIQADFGNLSVISVYFPSGSASEERQAAKFSFMKKVFPHFMALKNSGREILLCGDWNIAHKEIDLKNWKGNLKNSGFLPEEREWLTDLFRQGFIDIHRKMKPSEEEYTWWSNRGKAYEKNVGWRIDYQIGTIGISSAARNASVYKEIKFSDHAPLTIDYDFPH